MDLDPEVNGGILILHQFHEGKHQYEVEKVMKSKKESRKKMFVRRGDKLMQINSIDLEDLTPEELAQMLAEGNPMLTVHKAGRIKEQTKLSPPDEDTLHPVSKESTMLNFHWEMRQEEGLENKVEREGGEEKESGAAEEVVSQAQNEEDEESDLLIVTMTKTSISIVRGRGCDGESPCQGCHGTGCTLNDVVVVSESSTVTLVPRGSVIFKQEKLSNVLIEHVDTHRYLRGRCSQRSLYVSPNPEKITIYYYKSTSSLVEEGNYRGVPVVLNLTTSNCFLRCCKDGDRVFLQVEECEHQRLRQISKSDESTLAFVFYMKTDKTKQRKFESVLHHGWFINIVTQSDSVEMATLDGHREDHSFLFVIQK